MAPLIAPSTPLTPGELEALLCLVRSGQGLDHATAARVLQELRALRTALMWQEKRLEDDPLVRLRTAARRLRDAHDAHERAIAQPPSSTEWREAGNTLTMEWLDFRAALANASREKGR